MKTFTNFAAIALFSLPLLAHAGGKSASAAVQVSFEVKESCTVQSADKDAKAAEPSVACQLKTPYQLTRASEAAATSSDSKAGAIRQQAPGGEWTIYF
ncbi:hypothetical protein [Duganella sp.]|uniref:hypothetical protein n=1 Tax=Duganella sp. TaxID=1904440 RepID=UPI0031D6620D